MTRLTLCLLLLATSASATESVRIAKSADIKIGVNRIHDDQRGVTCYVYYDGGPGGISCIPTASCRPATSASSPRTKPNPNLHPHWRLGAGLMRGMSCEQDRLEQSA